MPAASASDLLIKALQDCAGCRSIVNQIKRGELHEDAFLSVFVQIARDAGLDANMVQLDASNAPLSDRNLTASVYPKGYKYRTLIFLELPDRLMRLEEGNKFTVKSYSTRSRAVRALPFKVEDHAWSQEDDTLQIEPEAWEMVEAIMDTKRLQVELAACALTGATPQARVLPRPRI